MKDILPSWKVRIFTIESLQPLLLISHEMLYEFLNFPQGQIPHSYCNEYSDFFFPVDFPRQKLQMTNNNLSLLKISIILFFHVLFHEPEMTGRVYMLC